MYSTGYIIVIRVFKRHLSDNIFYLYLLLFVFDTGQCTNKVRKVEGKNVWSASDHQIGKSAD